MKLSVPIFLLLISLCYDKTVAQSISDSTAESTYFIEQNALPTLKGRLVYNNYYVLGNSVAFQLTERIKISAGIVLVPQRPPFYATVQYSIPVGRDLFVGGSLGYYQIDYSADRSNYVFVPQLLITKGNQFINTTITGGVVRGQFLLGGSFLSSAINLPSRVNLVLSVSHRRSISKELYIITQNAFVSAQAPSGSRYKEILLLSGGIGWQLYPRSTLKAGVGALFFPKGEQNDRSGFLPFLGYSYVIR